jgi:diacylglycerol kinase (ATP)
VKSPHVGLKRVLHAVGYSWKGFRSTWKHEAAFRQELVLFVFLTPLAFWLGENSIEVIFLIATLLFVLIVELLNSAIESVVDRTGHEYHKLSGRAKDQASAAVLLSFLVATLIWGGFIVTKLMS